MQILEGKFRAGSCGSPQIRSLFRNFTRSYLSSLLHFGDKATQYVREG